MLLFQTDIEYRKKWDKLVIKLDVIDKEGVDGGCEVMHWVMHYPVNKHFSYSYFN